MAQFLVGIAGSGDPGHKNAVRGGLAKRGRSSVDTVERAAKALAGLKADGWGRRHERVALEWHRFRGTEVAKLFLLEARAALPGSPSESAHWADLTLLSLAGKRLEQYPDEIEKSLLRLRARLFQANALRCQGEFSEAHEEFVMTLSVADELDVRGFSFWAEAKSFLASLRKDQREFAAAIRESRAASALFRAAGEASNEVKARWQVATIHEQIGDFKAALVAVQQALPRLSEFQDPVLDIGLRHLEVSILARDGQFREAERKYQSLAPAYRHIPDRENFRLWVASLIAAGLGQSTEAEASFRAARDGFLAAKNPYDAALVTLDWTLFLLDQDRVEEVLPLAMSMGQAFEGLRVARETLASWNVFAEAAARRELTRSAAEELVRALGAERMSGPKGR